MAHATKNDWLTSIRWKQALYLAPIVCFLCFFLIWSNNALQVQELSYQNEQIPASFDGFRIVHLSDLHNKVFGKENQPLLEAVTALHPDIIVLTGDFVDMSNHTSIKKALLFMQQIPTIAPTYFILGNHELYMKPKTREAFLQDVSKAGVTILQDAQVTIPSDTGESFALLGLSNDSLQSDTLEQMMKVNNQSFTVLLAHEPQFLSDYAQTGVDLIFSGHTHGGQFRIPFTNIGIYAPDQGLLPKYASGVFVTQDTTMIVNRGLGNSGFPQRIFNRPEIVCVTLRV